MAGEDCGAKERLGHSRASASLVLVLIALHAALTLVLALMRFASVHNQTFDLALYARLAWGLVHGEPWDPIANGLGHLPFVLLPLGGLGALFGTVPTLLAAQSLALALAAWPLSLIGARRFGPTGGVAAAIAYLLYPNLGHVATYEFHPGNIAMLPLAYALATLDEPQAPPHRQTRALVWLCVAVVACRASLALQTAVIGAIALRRWPSWRRGALGLLAGSAGYFALSLAVQPLLGGALAASTDLHYGQWGGSPLGVLPALVRDPGLVAAHLLAPERASYLLRVLAPLALLPLLAPRYLAVALPPLALNLLSAFPTAQQLYSHYLTPAVPPLVAAALAGADRARAWLARVRPVHAARAGQALPIALCIACAAGGWIAGGLPFSRDFDPAPFRGDAATRTRRQLLARIPPEVSVQAPDPLLPHLAERTQVHRAPPPERGTQLVVLDVSHRARFAARGSLLRTVEEPNVRRWLARDDHRVVFAQGDLLMLERGLSPRGGLVARYFAGLAPAHSGRALTACLDVRQARLEGRQLQLEFVANGPCPGDLAIRFGADAAPKRVELLFDGLLSPLHLGRGDRVRSSYALSDAELERLKRTDLYVGALRSSGARPRPSDPVALPIPLHVAR